MRRGVIRATSILVKGDAAMHLFRRRSKRSVSRALSFERKAGKLQEITKVAVGIHVLLTRSFFGDGIPRRLLLRVSPVKPTSAPLRC